jgi:phosphate transport system substrate-binding protein
MRKFWLLCVPVIIFLGSCGSGTGEKGNIKAGGNDTTSLAGTIKITGTRVLHSMMTKWISEFGNANPKVKINLNGTPTETGIEDLLAGKADLAMISRPLTQEEKDKGLWSAPVALDAIVPVISFDNDFIQPLVMNGLTKEKLAAVFTGKIKNWGPLTGRKTNEAVKVFILSDSAGSTSVWDSFLSLKPGEKKGTKAASESDLMKSLTNTKSGIGYCSIMNAYDLKTGFRKEGICLVPIDFNGNGIIDDNEQYYDNFSLLFKAISNGKMPMPPAHELYIVAKSKPSDKLITEFFKWLLTTGQNYMPEMGYINLQKEKASTALETLK